jgi:lytic cellulose monooxygenase (C1-hydroxylating)
VLFIMRQSLVSLLWAGLASAHGHVKEYVIDGTTYPAFDPSHDYDAKFNISRIEWGFPKTRRDIGPGVSPVDDVNNLEITCRFRPLKAPGLEAVARSGASVTFKWLDWFSSHKGPVMTVSGPSARHRANCKVHGIASRVRQTGRRRLF